MEYYSDIEKNAVMSFAGKWTELEIIMLNKISQHQKPNITCSCSFVEPRPKLMMVMTIHDKVHCTHTWNYYSEIPSYY
jgi:hypothetical protein